MKKKIPKKKGFIIFRNAWGKEEKKVAPHLSRPFLGRKNDRERKKGVKVKTVPELHVTGKNPPLPWGGGVISLRGKRKRGGVSRPVQGILFLGGQGTGTRDGVQKKQEFER